MRVIFIFLVLLIGACTPQRRLLCLQKHHPYLFEQSQKDTYYIRTSIIDTSYVYSRSADTFYFHSDSITISQIFTRDTLRYYFKSRPCTTFVQKQIITPKPIPQDAKTSLEDYLKYFIVIFALLLLWKTWK